MAASTQRTIAVIARRRSRLSRLKLTYPDQAPHPTYDKVLARELLTRTSELPDSKRGLIVILTEYRHALADLATAPSISRDDAQPSTGNHS